MKSHQKLLLPSLVLTLLTPHAWADKDVTVRRIDADAPRVVIRKERDQGPMEKEKVTFLGIETAPASRTLRTQLGLPRDTGLVVTNVLENSPAANLLKQDDVLTKLDDQLLINMQQLGVLVRSKKEGDEIKLTIMRGGREQTLKAKLGSHEVPKVADNVFFHTIGSGPGEWQGFFEPGAMAGMEKLRNLPGMDGDRVRDVMRIIGREREHGALFSGPGVHIVTRKGRGSTILDLPKSNISYSDDDGAIDIKADDGKRTLTIKNAKGEVTFSGPINTEEERHNLPPEVRRRLEALESDGFEFEAGKDFKPEMVPLPPAPARTKISRDLGQFGSDATAFINKIWRG